MKYQARQDWLKVLSVIKSIDDSRQIEAAKNLIKLYKIQHGLDNDHHFLELELKMIQRKVK